MFLGLRSLIYPSADLNNDTTFWTRTLGFEPYFNQPFYVGFNVGGYELGLDPNATTQIPVAYWGVETIEAACAELIKKGVRVQDPVHEVGDGIKMATFLDETGTVFGIIENPHFKAK